MTHATNAITTSMIYAADSDDGLGDLDLSRSMITLAGWALRVRFVKIELSDCPCGQCVSEVEVNAVGFVITPAGAPLTSFDGDAVNVDVPAAIRPPWLKQLVDRTVPGLSAGLVATRAFLPHEETP